MNKSDNLPEVKARLIETGGRASQDIGLGRIVGQILVYLYLQQGSSPLDELEEDLGLSKASVSIAARQLEQLGLIKRVWVKGERKKFYKSADNIGEALQQGLLSLVNQKVNDFGEQLDICRDLLKTDLEIEANGEALFLRKRIDRAGRLQRRISKILNSPLVRVLTREKKADPLLKSRNMDKN